MSVDAKEFVLGFDGLWNTGNREAILSAVQDDSVVELVPTPPPPARGRYVGREEIAEFLDAFLPGFHADSRNFRVEDGEIVWDFVIQNDALRAMGADLVPGTGRVVLGDGATLRRFRAELDEETVAQLRPAAGAPPR